MIDEKDKELKIVQTIKPAKNHFSKVPWSYQLFIFETS